MITHNVHNPVYGCVYRDVRESTQRPFLSRPIYRLVADVKILSSWKVQCPLTPSISAFCTSLYLFPSDVSAASDSDVGDQQMLFTFLTNFQNFVVVPLISTCSRYPVHAKSSWTGHLLHVEINGTTTKFSTTFSFVSFPFLARLPSIIPVNATASN